MEGQTFFDNVQTQNSKYAAVAAPQRGAANLYSNLQGYAGGKNHKHSNPRTGSFQDIESAYRNLVIENRHISTNRRYVMPHRTGPYTPGVGQLQALQIPTPPHPLSQHLTHRPTKPPTAHPQLTFGTYPTEMPLAAPLTPTAPSHGSLVSQNVPNRPTFRYLRTQQLGGALVRPVSTSALHAVSRTKVLVEISQ